MHIKTRATLEDLYKVEGKAELVNGEIVHMPPTGDDPGSTYGQPVRRKSPRRQRLDQLFQELVSFPDLLRCPNFSIEVVCIQAEEVQRYDRRHARRRWGWVIVERRLLGVLERHVIATPSDLWSLISWELPEPFQTLHLARVLNRPRWFAQKVAYCLRESGASTAIGKVGNALVYSRAPLDGLRPHHRMEPLTERVAIQAPAHTAAKAADWHLSGTEMQALDGILQALAHRWDTPTAHLRPFRPW